MKKDVIAVTFYLYPKQIEWLNKQVEKSGMKRSKFIQRQLLPQVLWTKTETRGRKKKVLAGEKPKE